MAKPGPITIAESDIEAQLGELKSVGTVTVSAELLNRLYLASRAPADNNRRKGFANPAPLGLIGFVISATTFSGIILGWGGNTMLVGVLLGNFFSMMVMGMFSVFWLSFGMLQTPTLQLAQAYSPTGNAAEGAESTAYNAAIAMYLMVWGFWLLTTFVFSLKTNAVLATIILLASISSFLLGGAYWKVSIGDLAQASHLQTAGGSTFFAVSMLGWYRTFVIISAEMNMFSLPMGELSHLWPEKNLQRKH